MANRWHLKRTTDQVERLTFNGLEKYAKILKQEVQQDAPGSLKQGIRTRVSRIRKQITVASTHKSGLPVPVFVEFGTAPHKITPKTKKVLRWVDKDTGRTVFAKEVNHPGTKPQPYMRRGIARAGFRVREAFK